MRLFVLLMIHGILFISNLHGTMQAPDKLIWEGKEFYIREYGMIGIENRIRRSGLFPHFAAGSTANWRGYIATWSIVSNIFYLERMDATIYTNEKYHSITLQDLFPGKTPLAADWFDGVIILHDLRSETDDYRIFEIKKGCLTYTTNLNSDLYSDFMKNQLEYFKLSSEYKRYVSVWGVVKPELMYLVVQRLGHLFKREDTEYSLGKKWITNEAVIYQALEGDRLEIAGYHSVSGSITIPSRLDGKAVVGIADLAFDNCTALTGISLPDTVIAIGNHAFRNCSALRSITIPAFVTAIASDTFSSCDNLAEVNFAGSVTNIGQNAFAFCPKLERIDLPAQLISIENGAFLGCDSMKSIDIPDSVESIGGYVFQFCKNLSSIKIGKGLKSIGANAFNTCQSLKEFEIDPENRYFYSKDGVLFDKPMSELLYFPKWRTGSYSIPNKVKVIQENAFDGCREMSEIFIPLSVTDIGQGAFNDCSKLSNFTLPGSVTNIGYGAFRLCKGLVTVVISNKNLRFQGSAFIANENLSKIEFINKDCVFGPDVFFFTRFLRETSAFKIVAPSGGTIESYCISHHIKFEDKK